MRKNYVFAVTLILLSLFLWAGYYLYLEYKPTVYQNGTFVEIPLRDIEQFLELSA